MRAVRRRAFAYCATIVVVTASSAAHAGPNEQRLAQALFDDARRLMDQKRYSEACPKLAESQRLDPGGGTLLNLALCHASEGKTATALVEYNEGLAMATRDGRRDREELARAAITKLEAEVPRLTVAVPQAHRTPGLELKIDDTPLPSVAWDVPMPVDPGSHAVVATVPGRAPWTAVVSILEKEKKTLEIPNLAPRIEWAAGPTVPPPTMTPPNGSEPSAQETPPTVYPTTSKKDSNPVYIVALGTTIAASGTMVITGLLALSEQSKAEDNCLADRNWCKSQGGRDAASNAQTLSVVSTTAFVIAAIGVVTLFIVPSKKTAAKAAANALVFEGAF
jgi:hypothetical protein